jgi:hypothetical protein
MGKNKSGFMGIILALLAILGLLLLWHKNAASQNGQAHFWQVQSVDTVKFSRDPARQYADDPGFDKTIDSQVSSIADSGANYIAIGTPYDSEFVPFLKRWVIAARKYGLNVWFRGNFSGWEGWFGYPKITRAQHETMLKQFILDNGNLFADGDIFTACTECENGGPGDPRQNGDVAGHRQFLIDEYQLSRNTFAQTGRNVATNYFPMNADVARLVMDPDTTEALGGLVVIDHYVPTPQELNQGVNDLAGSSGGKVILGEFGAPIPDLQGNLTEAQQAAWIKTSLTLLSNNHNLLGINYWTGFGGSTELWNDDGSPRQAVGVLRNFFIPHVLKGVVMNEAGQSIKGATIVSTDGTVTTDSNGQFYLPFDGTSVKANVMAEGYYAVGIINNPNGVALTVTLRSKNETLFFKFQKLLYQTFISR